MSDNDVREKLVEIVKKAAYSSLPSNTEDFHLNMFVTNLLAHGVTVQEWISVTERLPEKNVNCIVHYRHAYCDNDGYFAIGFCYHDGEKFQFDPAYKVTHWMPLPKPPKGDGGAK